MVLVFVNRKLGYFLEIGDCHLFFERPLGNGGRFQDWFKSGFGRVDFWLFRLEKVGNQLILNLLRFYALHFRRLVFYDRTHERILLIFQNFLQLSQKFCLGVALGLGFFSQACNPVEPVFVVWNLFQCGVVACFADAVFFSLNDVSAALYFLRGDEFGFTLVRSIPKLSIVCTQSLDITLH